MTNAFGVELHSESVDVDRFTQLRLHDSGIFGRPSTKPSGMFGARRGLTAGRRQRQIFCDRIRQRADRQPRIGSDDVSRGPAGALQEFRESGFAGDEHNVVSCGRCVARS
jgi:hypothetical protein